MPINIPQITGARVRLVAFDGRHFESYAAACADPQVMAYIGDGQVLDRFAAWRSMASMIGHWALRGFGLWAVEHAESGAWIGRIGLFYPEGWPEPELGYLLARDHWRRGYAEEGSRLAIAYARDVLGYRRLVSYIQSGNAASIAVAERLGARLEGETEIQGNRSLVFAYNLSLSGKPT